VTAIHADELLDFYACERQNASHSDAAGDICGTCIAVCPYGRTRGSSSERPWTPTAW